MTNGEMISEDKSVGVGLRFVAVLIDSIVFFILGYLIAALTGGTTAGGFVLEGAPFFFFTLICFLYYILLEAFMGGTLGKLLIGIRVRMEDGSPLSLGSSVIRNLLRIIDGLFFYLVGAIFVWTSPSKQRLGDRLAKTVVVKK